MSPDRLDPTRSLKGYGMDSLMAMELVGTLRKELHCELPALEILHSDGSVRGIRDLLLPRLLATAHKTTAPHTPRHLPPARPARTDTRPADVVGHADHGSC
ncbi:hypothetical protein GCM10010218_54110 [Streptomyces mashuensis]|uniref:Carrier domain-containing protein n=2 Tax=Streptomyces mashuensis TaxID=33904 RepID=A0A919B7X4_9ACTN|nr:hypothetical protein GCM10010218_54110 [Streptomyces mashuensis]